MKLGAAALTPLRFCMVTTFYPPYHFGGDGIFVQRLAEALARRGHHVTVIHCADAYRLGGGVEPAAITHHPNIEVHTLASPLGMLSPLLTHQLGVPGLKRGAIRRILSAGDFDVIHFHNISLVGGPGILAYGDAVKLYTAHEYWLVCPLSTLWKFQRRNCEARSCVTCTLNARRPPQWWRYTQLLERNLGHLDAIISPSEFLIHKHHEMGLQAKFTHLPNFLPDAAGAPSGAGTTHSGETGRPFFLVVGRLEKSKGVHRAIEVFQQADHADLLIIGTGQYEAELRAMASGYANIHLLGAMPYTQVVDFYRRAVAVIVPSIWDEPFGLIVIEAYSQRTPVIVNNAGALPELVAASGGGIVYDDTNGLQRAVASLLQSPQRRNELGEQGYAAYRRLWTEEQHLQRYLELIGEIGTRRQAAAP
ncbi:MAG: glycosyltransferase family 4 protein [Halioglobus sp.]